MTPDELYEQIKKLIGGERVGPDERIGTGALDERQLARFGQLAGKYGGGLPMTPVEAAELDALTRRWHAGGASTRPAKAKGGRIAASWLDGVPMDDGARWIDGQVATGGPRTAHTNPVTDPPRWATVEEMKRRLNDQTPGDPYMVRFTAQDKTQDAFARASEAVRDAADAFAKAAGVRPPFKVKATAYAVPVPDRYGDGVHWRLECSAGCPAPAWLSPSKASAVSACQGHIDLVHR